MTTKTKNSRKNVARSPRTRDERGTNAPHVRRAYVPILHEFRAHTKKNDARLWIPIETSLLVRYEFASCSLQTRYVFVAILLYCGANGISEVPLDAKFMASVLVADERTIAKSFEELLFKNLLVERIEREEIKAQTDRKETSGDGVSVKFENLSQNGSENQSKLSNEKLLPGSSNGNGTSSQFTIEECLKYVELCKAKGANINNPQALASHLFKSAEADAFILAALYPERAIAAERETFGEPIQLTDEPCSVCFGARLADIDGKGFRACVHCRNERGKSTGLEPEGETNDAND